jgi:hypothetical protein
MALSIVAYFDLLGLKDYWSILGQPQPPAQLKVVTLEKYKISAVLKTNPKL